MSSNPLRRLEILREAGRDLRYLLNRGYRKESALKLVGDKYLLDKSERLVLFRAIYPEKDAEEIEKKRVRAENLKNAHIWIDGFNVLNTVEAALKGETLLVCDDGTIRDFSQIYGGYEISEYTWKAVELILDVLKNLGVSEAKILLESQISRSGELAGAIRKIMGGRGLQGTAETSKSVDSQLSKTDAIVSTSDSAILLRCRRHFDLAAHTIKTKISQTKILKL